MENEQKKQTIETLRQTIKEWDISGRIGETVSRIKMSLSSKVCKLYYEKRHMESCSFCKGYRRKQRHFI